MARNRVIKPEFWSDEKTGMLDCKSKCLFIGMLNHCDDEGLIKANPIYLKSRIFPYQGEMDEKEVEKLLLNLNKVGIIFLYKKNNQSFAWIIKFRVHQKLDHPGMAKNPPPDIKNKGYSDAIFRRDGHICHYCGEYVDTMAEKDDGDSNAPCIVYLVDKKSGGKDYPNNLKCACNCCNPDRKGFDERSANGREDQTNGRESSLSPRRALAPKSKEVKLKEVKKESPTKKEFSPAKVSTSEKSPPLEKKLSGFSLKKNKQAFKDTSHDIEDIFKNISKLCSDIEFIQNKNPKRKAFKIKAFIQQNLNSCKHPKAIWKALLGISIYWKQTIDPWAYCEGIITKENPILNEAEGVRICEEMKKMDSKELKSLTDGMFEEIK